nr:MAG: capsid protein [Hemiptera picorna-like virus]
MFSFSNALLVAVISSFSVLTIHYPAVVVELIQTYYVDIFFAFSVNQWKVILPMLTMLMFTPFFFMWKLRRTRFVYNGRYLSAEALGITSEDKTVATNSDESNQTSNTGTSKMTVTAKQTQFAPNLNDDITLKRAVITEPYSTSMYVGQYTFSSSNVLNDVIFDIPSNAIYTNKNFQRLFIDKRFARFDVRYTINVTGNPMSTGILAMASLPYQTVLPSSPADQDTSLNYTWLNTYDRVLSSNHVLVDMSIDGVYKIDQPYTYYTKYLSMFSYTTVPSYASLIATVVSPYLPATGQTTAINIEVYANLVNIESQDTAAYNSQTGIESDVLTDYLKLYECQGLIDIGTTTNVVTQLDHINNASVPVDVTGDHITASVPASAALDNPPDPRNAETSVFRMAYQKLFSYWNTVDLWRTTNTPKEVVEFDTRLSEELRLDVDEMSIDFFRGRWFSPTNVNAVVPITTSTSTGTLLAQYPITPIPTTGPFSTNFQSGQNCDFTQWLCSLFRWWRGSMRYRIVVASNQFKRGKVLVCINYGQMNDAASTLPNTITSGRIDPRSLPHVIIDLSNKDRFIDIDVPFKSTTEYKRVPNITNNLNTIVPEMSLGQIGIYLISPLQVSNGTATTVNLNVFQAYGKDFELFGPQQIPGAGYCSQAMLEPGGPITGTTLSKMVLPTDSILQLLRTRPAYVGTFQFNAPTLSPGPSTSPAIIPIHPTLLSGDPLWSAVCSMYGGMRGGYRLNLRFLNIANSSSIRISYFESMIPQGGDGTNYTTSAGSKFETTNLGGWSETAASDVAMANISTMNAIQSNILPNYYTAVAPSTANSVRLYGIPPIQEVVVDPYSQPEVIIEIPDPTPIYRSQSMIRVPPNYAFGATGKYNPYYDRTIGMLVIQPTDSFSDVVPGNFIGSVTVTMTAADDFRAFWYNGGPTAITPYSVGATGTTTTYDYFNPAGR